MATETERKFLVKGDFKHLAVKNISITQAYLSKDPDRTIRIRIADDKAYITIKGRFISKTVSRSEWEYQIPVHEAAEILNLCLPGRVIKTRYLVPAGSHTFEVDLFHDKNDGLVIAEIELSSADEQFERPEWLGKEVTGDPLYYNSNLCK